MAFNKYANAALIKPAITFAGWGAVCEKANSTSFSSRNAAKVVIDKYDPKQYLLSHCTIIASVETEVSTQPLGRSVVDGFQIERKYPDWLITSDTSKYINNNNDAWERKLLLSSFRTFTGGENYVEHIQIPELSKGKIIDSAARDIGDSIYVDILVATDRKHKPLIEAISSGQLSTLSMGCFLPGTPVTMADGTRLPIEEVRPGSMVLTHKGRAREVLNQQIRGGLWQMRRIKIKGVPDSIEATGTHPLFVLRPASVCGCGCQESLSTKDADPVRRMTKRFKKGHNKRVLNSNGSYSLDEFRTRQQKLDDIQTLKVEKVRADELRVGDYVVFPKFESDVIGDPGISKARLLGYFLAEGSFLKRKGVPVEVQFNFSSKERHTFVQEVVDLLQDEFHGCKPWVQDREDRNTSTVHVSGSEIASWFKRHGGEYSHQKRLSPEAMQWSVESQTNLLGAWLNGDGHRHVGGHAVGTTTSYDLLCQLHTLSVRAGLPVWVDCVFGGRTVTIAEAVSNGQALRHDETGKLASFNIYFPQSSSSVLAEVSAKAPRDRSHKKHQHLRSFDDKVIFPITSIESFMYEGFVHDIEVEEDHSYQVHGFAVSNCQVAFTTCTKCGNVAYDETQLCPHIKYFKGSDFYDSFGKKRKVAELCGHIEAEPGSVRFIEASWVANPAFTGAVLRNILSAEDIQNINGKMQVAFSMPPRVSQPNSIQKSASLSVNIPPSVRRIVSQDFGMDDPKQETETPNEGSGKSGDTAIQKAISDLADAVREEAIKKVRDEISKNETSKMDLDENRENESIIKSAMKTPEWQGIAKGVLATIKNPTFSKKVLLGLVLYKSGGWSSLVKTGNFTGRDLLAVSRMMDMMKRSSKAGESRIYRTVLAVNGMAPYKDIESYLSACRQVVGRDLSADEVSSLIDKGRLFALGS